MLAPACPTPQSSSSRLSGSSSDDDVLLGTEHSLPLASQPSISCCATLASSSCTAAAAGPAACTDAPWPCSCSPVGTAPASALLQLAPSTTVWRAAGTADGATVTSASQAPLLMQQLCVGAAAWCACWAASASRAARLARLSSSTASTSASTSPAAWKQGYAYLAAMQVQPCTHALPSTARRRPSAPGGASSASACRAAVKAARRSRAARSSAGSSSSSCTSSGKPSRSGSPPSGSRPMASRRCGQGRKGARCSWCLVDRQQCRGGEGPHSCQSLALGSFGQLLPPMLCNTAHPTHLAPAGLPDLAQRRHLACLTIPLALVKGSTRLALGVQPARRPAPAVGKGCAVAGAVLLPVGHHARI